MPNTWWPTMPSAPTPTAAMVPENSWPGMAWRRFSPDLVCVVGCHNNSVPVTPTAWTRIKTSPRWGPGVLTSACTSPGTGRESSHCQAFILHLVVKVDFCSGTGRLLAHPRLGVLLRLAGVGHLPRPGGQRAEKRGEPFRHRRVDQERIAQRRGGQARGHR